MSRSAIIIGAIVAAVALGGGFWVLEVSQPEVATAAQVPVQAPAITPVVEAGPVSAAPVPPPPPTLPP
jgi:hypothetical protein